MSSEASAQPGGAPAQGEPSEEELRAAYEAELSRITATDMMAQAAVSLLNIGARRLGAPEAPGQQPGAGDVQRDLEQVRDAIDGARALLEILERRIPRELGPLRDALSRLQMAYAREVQGAPGEAQPAGRADAAGKAQAPSAEPGPPSPAGEDPGAGGQQQGEQPAGEPERDRPGPAEASGRLWVPGR